MKNGAKAARLARIERYKAQGLEPGMPKSKPKGRHKLVVFDNEVMPKPKLKRMVELIVSHKLTTAHFDGRLELPEEVKLFMQQAGAPSRQAFCNAIYKIRRGFVSAAPVNAKRFAEAKHMRRQGGYR